MAKNKPEPASADEHAGHGGSYVIDENGKRALVERTGEADAKPATEPKKPDQE